jgi:hypothetical protein
LHIDHHSLHTLMMLTRYNEGMTKSELEYEEMRQQALVCQGAL